MGLIKALYNWFGARGAPAAEPADQSYRVFTKKYDLTIGAEDLAKRLSELVEIQKPAAIFPVDQQMVADARSSLDTNFRISCERLSATLSREQLQDTVVSLLLDHSGSMRGMRMALVAEFAEAIADALSELGVAVDVLGFTTRSWRGGGARANWIAQFRLRHPGRLCDLLHLVHRDALTNTQTTPHHFALMRREELYKENIDGEALLWARERLVAQNRTKKVLVVVSDGAPVDDSTLSANWGSILSDHLKTVVAEIERGAEIVLGGLGVDHEVLGFYHNSVGAVPHTRLPFVAPAFVEQLLRAAHGLSASPAQER